MEEPTTAPSRKIHDHQLLGLDGDLNHYIDITAMDGPGPGDASHEYLLEISDVTRDEHEQPIASTTSQQVIRFQKGPVKEAGYNGITQEALLAIVIDRLRAFGAGPLATREGSLALTHCQDALHWLQHRTQDRARRGVIGTNNK